jgi:hypothetical protein
MAADPDRKTALPANDAWTGMLVVSLVALLAACALLFLDWRHYKDKPDKLKSAPITLESDEAAGKEPPPKGAEGPAGGDKKAPDDKKGGEKKGGEK